MTRVADVYPVEATGSLVMNSCIDSKAVETMTDTHVQNTDKAYCRAGYKEKYYLKREEARAPGVSCYNSA